MQEGGEAIAGVRGGLILVLMFPKHLPSGILKRWFDGGTAVQAKRRERSSEAECGTWRRQANSGRKGRAQGLPTYLSRRSMDVLGLLHRIL